MIDVWRTSLRVALSSIFLNRLRTSLTVLGIVIGVASVIILVSIGSGLQGFISDQFQGLGANLLIVLPGKFDVKTGRGRVPGTSLPASKFTLDDVRALSRETQNIKAVVPILASNATAKFGAREVKTTVNGTTANYVTVRQAPVDQGIFFSADQERSNRRVAVLGSTVAQNLFGQGSKAPLGQSVLIDGEHFTLIGVLKTRGVSLGGADLDDQIYIPVAAAQKKFGQDNLSLLNLEAHSTETIDQAVAAATRVLRRRLRDDDFTVLNQNDLLSTVKSILGALTLALGGIAAISLLVGGIGIMNIMLVTVRERTKEIGLRKALGARRSDILWQFLIEAVVLASLGGFLGVLLGFSGSLILASFLASQVTLWSVIVSFSFSVGVGVIFGFLPSYQASRLDPIEALRYE